MLSVLLESACRAELLAPAAGGPQHWSDERETRFKRDQAWSHTQLEAGWRYLLRRSGHVMPQASEPAE